MISTILIAGGGQAGAQAVDTLRRSGFAGHLVLVGDEPYLPYQRPPLSKKYLAGELAADRLLFRHQTYYDEHRVDVRLGRSVLKIDAAARRATLSDGERVDYDRLLLCLGARARPLRCPGVEAPGVHCLRGIADADAIRAGLKAGARVMVIGGGYVGLETAAAARQQGCAATVLEMADRLMNRVVSPTVSDFYAGEHRGHGVDLKCNARVAGIESERGILRALCEDGTVHEGEMIVAGVGALPNSELAADAGLACDDGIVVDEYCRTSDPAIYAAGDCTNHPSPHFGFRTRLESVDNAFEQAKVAALNMLDRPTVYDRVPWFWSDQFDLKLLIVGLSKGHDRLVLRGDPSARSFSVCYLKGGELIALEAVNSSADYMAARKLIAERAHPDLAKLANPAVALKDAL